MNWKSWLLTILQKVFPSEKPDYEELQAWAKEQVVHPIYAIELTCYRHGKPIALEQRSVGVWHCPICSAPKPAVWIDETKRKHVQVQMSTYEPPQRTTEKPAVIPYPQGRYFQKRRKEFETTRLMPAAPRLARALSSAERVQISADAHKPPSPDATEYEVPAFLKDQAM